MIEALAKAQSQNSFQNSLLGNSCVVRAEPWNNLKGLKTLLLNQKCHLVLIGQLWNTLLMTELIEPEWLRVRDSIRYSSISQTELFRLCVDGEIESVHKLKPGQAKGIRLINKKSLDAYIRSFLPGGKRYQKSIAEQHTTNNYASRLRARSSPQIL